MSEDRNREWHGGRERKNSAVLQQQKKPGLVIYGSPYS